jgi:Apea-like HEPN
LRDYFYRDFAGGQNGNKDERLRHRLLRITERLASSTYVLSGFIRRSDEVFEQVFAKLSNELSSTTLTRRMVGVLYRQQIEAPYSVGQNIFLRPSNVIEKNEWIDQMGSIGILGLPGPLDQTLSQLMHARGVIDIALEGPRSSEWPPHGLEPLNLAQTALRLGAGARGTIIAAFIFVDSIGYGYGKAVWKNADPPPPGDEEAIDKEMADATRLALRSIRQSANRETVEFASRRLGYGSGRSRHEDAFIDYMVGLESLLTDRNQKGEVTYKISMRTAAMLGETPDERMQIKRDVNRLYGKRSDVLHGTATELDLAADAERLCAYLRRLILKVLSLDRHFEAHHADRLMLGENTTSNDSHESEA